MGFNMEKYSSYQNTSTISGKTPGFVGVRNLERSNDETDLRVLVHGILDMSLQCNVAA